MLLLKSVMHNNCNSLRNHAAAILKLVLQYCNHLAWGDDSKI